MPIICLTGGIAAGKSTAARYFATRGAKVIDADQLGHATYEAGTAANDRLVETFGDAVRAEDGGIDRKALGGHGLWQARSFEAVDGHCLAGDSIIGGGSNAKPS